ncbi:hypothetical protein NZD89_28545 (plasmid) [Alicyclobacillus fastidiosus]|uniref:Uncharacterized protein n=1 Tax=Alicyclobacillus fastidiosus TaxID=392011 RepID=A0ABY6ZPJ2_9BACL|nr:hypothetical protein [Alicyclobacillus fastidiosus]WAH44809.1 hypothetical protein NZD89_28545 [Alicyclobacillus fastidiosus]GMA65770.1 hypothetical protein GCM10025859_62100 [Alicyclobacillus fastidiosus]
MKDYMNATEQENFLMAWGAQSAIAIVIDEAQGHVTKEVSADLKRARSFTERALRNWMEPMNQKTRGIITKKAAGVTLGLLNDAKKKAEQVAFLKHMQKVREEAYKENPDHVLDLAEITMTAVWVLVQKFTKPQYTVVYRNRIHTTYGVLKYFCTRTVWSAATAHPCRSNQCPLV